MRRVVGAMTVVGISIVLAGAWWVLRYRDDPAPILQPTGSGAERATQDDDGPSGVRLREPSDTVGQRAASESALDRAPESDPLPAAAPSPPVTLSFVVHGPYRVPVPGAVASFFAASWNAPPGLRVADAVSGADGTFDVNLPAAQSVVARVEAAGFETHEWWMPSPATDADWVSVIQLDSLAVRSIEGDLMTPDGRALPEELVALLRGTGASADERLDPRESTRSAPATVVFEPSGVGFQDRATAEARDVRPRVGIDDAGGFAFEPQPAGVAGTLRLEWCGRELSHATWTGRESRARLVIDPAALLDGLASLDVVVTGFGGAMDFEWLTVLLSSVDGRIAFDRRIARGDSRPLRFARLTPGRYVVEVRARDVLASASTTLESGEHESVALDASAAARLTIDVAGWPESGAPMPSVLPAKGFGPEVPVRPRRGESSGAFAADVPAGRFVVALNGEVRMVDVVAGETTNVRLVWSAATSVSIEIVADSGAWNVLAPWIEVWLTIERADGICLRREWLDLAIEDDGSARIVVALAPGDYVVRVERNGATAERPFTVGAGEGAHTVQVR